MTMNFRVLFFLGGMLATFSSQTFAEAEGVLFFAAGEADVEKYEFSGTDTAIKLGTGFRVTETSGIEIYWTRYGEPEDQLAVPGFGNRDVTINLHSVAFQYVRYVPLAGSVDMLARVGLAAWVSEFDVDNVATYDDNGIDWIVGAGIQARVLEGWALRVEWEYTELRHFEVNLLSMGLAHYFD